MVPRYFLQLRGGPDETLDYGCLECADLPSLNQILLNIARDLMAGDVLDGLIDLRLRIDADNKETSCTVSHLPRL